VDTDPVTVTAAYRVNPGRETEFYAWAIEMLNAAAPLPGYLGGGVMGSGQASSEWHVIYRFDRDVSAQGWESSLERVRLATRAGPFVQEKGSQRTSGLQNWLKGPVRPLPPPPKWKLWLVNLGAVFPPDLMFNPLVIPFLEGTIFLLRTLALCLGVTAMVTWLVMPRLQRLLKKWLYPPLQSIRGRHRRMAMDGPKQGGKSGWNR
jgi:antibiotic biosynthesis monooxygenase (ABM) superfamily enzyme